MKATATKPVVLDASITAAWWFESEKTPYSEQIFNRIIDGVQAWVPAVWLFEIANALLTAERRQRSTASQTSLFLDQLTQFDISIDVVSHPRIFGVVLSEARQHHLTIYDAAYLELALRKSLPLATLDAAMHRAAKKLGIPAA